MAVKKYRPESIQIGNMDTLNNLLTDQFVASLGFYSTPKGLYRALAGNEFVDDLILSIQTGQVTTDSIRSFVTEITRTFHRGEKFANENILAAICVALEELPNDFAEEFLIDLARVNVIEFPLAPKVAVICLSNLFRSPKSSDSIESCKITIDVDTDPEEIEFDFFASSAIEQNDLVVMEFECDV